MQWVLPPPPPPPPGGGDPEKSERGDPRLFLQFKCVALDELKARM